MSLTVGAGASTVPGLGGPGEMHKKAFAFQTSALVRSYGKARPGPLADDISFF